MEDAVVARGGAGTLHYYALLRGSAFPHTRRLVSDSMDY